MESVFSAKSQRHDPESIGRHQGTVDAVWQSTVDPDAQMTISTSRYQQHICSSMWQPARVGDTMQTTH